MNTERKKKFLIAVLENIEKERLPVWWMKILIQQGGVEWNVLDSLITVIKDAASSATSAHAQTKLKKSLSLLESIRAQEKQSKKIDQADLDELERQLQNI